MTTPAPRLIEIFRAGRHTDLHGRALEFTTADLQAIAEAYNPTVSPAPVVVGHPKTDDPAYGWIKRLVANDDSLFAEEEQVDAAFDDLRRAGRFRQRSASFFLPESPNNPTPGKFYLKHVGWLGAAAPAVKGLKPVAFAGDERGVVEFALAEGDRSWWLSSISDMFRRLRESLIEKDGIAKADLVLPSYSIDSLRSAADNAASTAFADPPVSISAAAVTEGAPNPSREDPAVTQPNDAQFAERQQQLDAREARLKQAEQRLADRRAKELRDDATAFADTLIQGGRLLPKDKAAVVEVLLALPTDKPLSFADGDTTVERPAQELLRELLASMPPQVDFAEKSASRGTVASADFAAPTGALVNASQLDLYAKAKAYQAQHPGTPWLTAVQAVGG